MNSQVASSFLWPVGGKMGAWEGWQEGWSLVPNAWVRAQHDHFGSSGPECACGHRCHGAAPGTASGHSLKLRQLALQTAWFGAMTGSKGLRGKSKSSSNASSGSQGHRRLNSRKAASAPRRPQSQPAAVAPLHQCKLAPHHVRSAMIWTDPKMQALRRFVESSAPPAPELVPDTESVVGSLGDDLSIDADFESGSETAPMSPSRRTSACSRRTSCSRRMSALSRRTGTSSRRGSATSLAASRRQSMETDGSKSVVFSDLPRQNTQTTATDEGKRRRPSSAGAIVQSQQYSKERTWGVDEVNRRTKALAREAMQRPSQTQGLVRPASASNADDYRRSFLYPGNAEHQAAEARREKLRAFDTKSPQQNFLKLAGHSLQKLFVDFDLAHNSGGEAQTHKNRCAHADRVVDWFGRHVLGREPPPDPKPTVPAWIFLRDDEKPPPGSLRPRSALTRSSIHFSQVGHGHGLPPPLCKSVSVPCF